jgi:hypothetical protein
MWYWTAFQMVNATKPTTDRPDCSLEMWRSGENGKIYIWGGSRQSARPLKKKKYSDLHLQHETNLECELYL